MKGIHWNTKLSQMCLLFLISDDEKNFVWWDWVFARSKLVLGLSNDPLMDKNYLQACGMVWIFSGITHYITVSNVTRSLSLLSVTFLIHNLKILFPGLHQISFRIKWIQLGIWIWILISSQIIIQSSFLRCSLMLPVATFLTWCTLFTVGAEDDACISMRWEVCSEIMTC